MILVRLPQFRETPDSLMGFLLCQSLMQKGHDLLIVPDHCNSYEYEKDMAKAITKISRGSAHISRPKDIHSDQKISAIIGVAQRIQIAINFYKKFKCKLIIATNVALSVENITHLTEWADELWSIGPELYNDHQMIIPKNSKLEHESFLLVTNWALECRLNTKEENLVITEGLIKVVSIWNEGEEYVVDGVAQQVAGSRLEDFDIVLNAIAEVNKRMHGSRIVWCVYGLTNRNSKLFKTLCRDHVNPERLSTHDSLQGILSNCSLFILPDQYEAYHNIAATSVLIKRIPCLVPHTSSIGKLLLQFGFTSGPTILNLRGIPHLDEKTWTDSIGEKLCTKFHFPEFHFPDVLILQLMDPHMMIAEVINMSVHFVVFGTDICI